MKDDTLVKTALEHMHPEFRPIFETMLDRDEIPDTKSVSEVVEHFEAKELSNIEELALTALVGARNRSQINKFRRKMDFAQQCAALGLFRLGYNRENIAKLFSIDRRTVTHIHNSISPHYKSVREEEKLLGNLRFIEKYVTPEIRAMAEAAKSESPKYAGNNPNATGRRGMHSMRNAMCDRIHRVLIEYRRPSDTPDISVEGWYYCDLDSEWPEAWFSNDEARRNSQACYNHAMNDISE